jgi:hypothetical protein
MAADGEDPVTRWVSDLKAGDRGGARTAACGRSGGRPGVIRERRE